jgi:acyl carrier protein
MTADTIETIREAVSRVTGRDLVSIGAQDPLGLDSINRITLIVELEHLFQKALDTEQATPEAFDTLAALAAFVESQG